MHFGKNLVEQVKGSFTEKAKIVDSAPESTGSNHQYEPCLFCAACSKTELSISGKIWRSGKVSFIEKAKIVVSGSICSAPERTGSELQYEPFLCSVACS